MAQDPLATLKASPLRRVFGYSVMLGLGGISIYLALASAPTIGFRVLLLGFGVAILFAAECMRRATQMSVMLTDDGLFDSSGAQLVSLDNIAKIERGLFAFKPSHGFVVITKEKQPRAWAPGLWWRQGRRIGVGGVTPSGPAKFMAERLSMLLIDHNTKMSSHQ